MPCHAVLCRGMKVAAFIRHHQASKSRRASGGDGSGGDGGDDGSPGLDPSRWLGWDGEGREGGGGGLPFGYYLDLDALTVARAAARCGAQCSALFYAEAWMEGRFGESAGITASRWRDNGEDSAGYKLDWLDSADDDGDDGSPRNEDGCPRGALRKEASWGPRAQTGKRQVERLLLDVFSSLPDPDSIYGVSTAAADLSAQATVYAHEGGWQSTLPAYDTLLQSATAGTATSTSGPVEGGVGGVSVPEAGLQTGIASCLQVRAALVPTRIPVGNAKILKLLVLSRRWLSTLTTAYLLYDGRVNLGYRRA